MKLKLHYCSRVLIGGAAVMGPLFGGAGLSAGEIATDGSLGPAATPLIKDVAETFTIDESLGLRANQNLFHSFTTFNLDPGEIAQFTEAAPGTTNHVISRVTGGVSTIAGTINNIPNASFWFVNTAGIIVAPGADFNVGGALALGAVDYVQFADGTRFHALDNPADTVSSLTLNPVQFGFLDATTAGSLAISGLTISGTDAVGDLLFAGGDISITGSDITNLPESSTGADEYTPVGASIMTFGGTTTLDSSTLTTEATGAVNAGDITLASAGDVFIRNGSFVTSTPAETGSGNDPGHAGAVTINATNDLDVSDSTLATSTAVGSAGGVSANTLTLTGNSVTVSGSNLFAQAETVSTIPGAIAIGSTLDTNISTSVLQAGTPPDNTRDSGGAISIASILGDVNLNDSLLTISRGGRTELPGDPQASQDITFDFTPAPTPQRDLLQVAAAGTISGVNTSFSSKTLADFSAGDITLAASAIVLDGGDILAASSGAGDAGQILLGGPGNAVGTAIADTDLLADSIQLTGGVDISAEVVGREIPLSIGGVFNLRPDAGAINILSSGPVTLVGVDASDVASIISDSSDNAGSAGVVRIEGTSFNASFAEISTQTDSEVQGTTASIDLLFTDTVQLQDTDVSAATNGATAGGDIRLTGASLDARGGSISSTTTAQGDAGNIVLGGPGSTVLIPQATGAVSLTGGVDVTVSAEAGATGTAGRIDILSTDAVTLAGGTNEVEISSASNIGGGPAGSINIQGDSLTSTDALISTQTSSDSGASAVIDLLFDGSVALTDTRVRSAASATTNAGDIALAGQQISITGGEISAASTGSGNAGAIQIDAVTSLAIDGQSGTPVVISSAAGAAANQAGSITLSGETLDAGDISLTTEAAGSGGLPASIDLTFSDTITLGNAQIVASASGGTDGGTIDLSAANVILDAVDINAATQGIGRAGDITVNADTLSVQAGAISATSTAPANAGDAGTISLNAPTRIDVNGNTANVLISSAAVAGSAGSVELISDDITLRNARIDTQTGGSTVGTVATISLGQATTTDIQLTNVDVVASTSGANDAGSIALLADNIVVDGTLSGVGIDSSSSSSSAAGDIAVQATTFDVTDGAISARATADGAAGSIELIVGQSLNSTNTLISSSAADAAAGAVTLMAPAISLDQTSVTTETAGTDVTAVAASIRVGDSQTTSLALTDSALVASTSGVTNAGNISVTADVLDVDGTFVGRGIEAASSGDGAAGSVALVSDQLDLTDGVIAATSTGGGTAGTISIDVATSLVTSNSTISSSAANAAAGEVSLDAQTFAFTTTEVSTETGGSDPSATAASIRLGDEQTDALTLSNSALLASTSGQTDAGSIVITADVIDVSGTLLGQGIEAASSGDGDAGSVSFTTSHLDMSNGVIAAASSGNGEAGTIDIDVATSLISDNTTISTAATNAAAGEITLDATSFALSRTQVSTETGGSDPTASAASIRVGDQLTDTVTLADSALIASTSGQIDAGSIQVQAEVLDVSGSLAGRGIEAASSGDGAAGSIALTAEQLALTNGVIAATSTGNGTAGTIVVDVTTSLISENSLISSSAANAAAGQVSLDAQTLAFSNTLVATESGGADANAAAATIRLGSNGAQRTVLVDSAVLASTSGQTDAGNVTVTADVIEIDGTLSGQGIEAASSGDGDAGSIALATNALTLTDAIVAAASTGNGAAGTIDIDVSTSLTSIDSVISSSATNSAAGEVSLNAVTVELTETLVATEAGGGNATAAAASIRIGDQQTTELTLTDSALVASTSGLTDAGSIAVQAADIDISGTLAGRGVEAASSGDGDAGSIAFTSSSLGFSDTVIAASSTGNGAAGAIEMTVASDLEATDSTISSSAANAGAGEITASAITLSVANSLVTTQTGGDDLSTTPASIRLGNDATQTIELRDSAVLASTSGQTPAGNVFVWGDEVSVTGLLNGRGIEANSTATNSGSAGAILFDAENLTLSQTTLLTSTVSDFNPPQTIAGFGQIGSGVIDAEVTGDIAITASVLAATSAGAQDAGSVNLTGANIVVENTSSLGAQTAGSGNAGSVQLSAVDTLEISSSDIGSRSLQPLSGPGGAAGLVALQANEVTVTDSVVSTSTAGVASALLGTIDVQATGDLILDGSEVSANTIADAAAGSITLNAGNISLINGADVLAVTSGSGDAGNIALTTPGQLTINAQSEVSARSTDLGNAGSVELDSVGPVTIQGATIASSSNGADVGLAGSVSINAADVTLLGVNISTQTASNAALDLDGPGQIDIFSGAGIVLDGTTITSSTTALADAGDVVLIAANGDIALSNNTLITASSNNVGDAGDVTLSATGDITLPIGTEVSARAQALGGAGSLLLEAGGIILVEGGLVSTSSSGLNGGTAGDIELNGQDVRFVNAIISTESASNAVTDRGEQDDDEPATSPEGIDLRPGTINITSVNDVVLVQDSQLSASVSGQDNGGNIIIDARDLRIVDGSTLETRASGLGNSGAIVLRIANDLRVTSPADAVGRDQQSAILTNSQRSIGGAISANVEGVVFMESGLIESSVDTAIGEGGNIFLTTNGLFLVGSQILARADQGNGGEINIRRGDGGFGTGAPTVFDGLFLIDSRTLINADSQGGVSGQVNVDSPDADLAAIVEVVDARIVEDPTLADDICNPASIESQSSFIIEDQGGVAPAPDAYFSAGVIPPGEPAATAQHNTQTKPVFIVSASGGCE